MTQSSDLALTSHYISNEFYQKLIEDYSDWQRPELEIEDLATRDSCRRYLEKEARLLQDRQFDIWLGMFTGECLYWVPCTPNAGDPRREVAVAFDDRRRLEDRVYRLQLSHAWSQVPVSRTVRMISNVEIFSTNNEDVVMVRSNFTINEFWASEIRLWSGWYGHRLIRIDRGWKILIKQVNLINCDQNLRNPSIIL